MRAQKRVKNKQRSETTSFHWPSKPKMADELQVGDWFIEVLTKKDKSILVNPPCQLLLVDNYVRNARPRKERWVFHASEPQREIPQREMHGPARSVGYFTLRFRGVAKL